MHKGEEPCVPATLCKIGWKGGYEGGRKGEVEEGRRK